MRGKQKNLAKAFDCCVEVENEIEVKQDIKDLKGGDGGEGGEGGSAGGAGGNAEATQNTTAVIENDTVVNCGVSCVPLLKKQKNKNSFRK